MPDNLNDLQDWLNDDGFSTPPIKSVKHPEGKVYLIPSPDTRTGARLTALAELGKKVAGKAEVQAKDLARLNLDDEEEREFTVQVLGAAFAEMEADGVPWLAVQRLTRYAFIYFTVGEQAAQDALASGALSGKVPAPNRAQRRSSAKAPRAPRASTGSRATRTK